MNKEKWNKLYEKTWAGCNGELLREMRQVREIIITHFGLHVSEIEEGITDTRYFDMMIRNKDMDNGRAVRAKFELNDSFSAEETWDGFNVIFELVTNDARSIFCYSPFNFSDDCWVFSLDELVGRVRGIDNLGVFDSLNNELIVD